MIQLCTVLNINDNTGAQKGVCLKVLNSIFEVNIIL